MGPGRSIQMATTSQWSEGAPKEEKSRLKRHQGKPVGVVWVCCSSHLDWPEWWTGSTQLGQLLLGFACMGGRVGTPPMPSRAAPFHDIGGVPWQQTSNCSQWAALSKVRVHLEETPNVAVLKERHIPLSPWYTIPKKKCKTVPISFRQPVMIVCGTSIELWVLDSAQPCCGLILVL